MKQKEKKSFNIFDTIAIVVAIILFQILDGYVKIGSPMINELIKFILVAILLIIFWFIKYYFLDRKK